MYSNFLNVPIIYFRYAKNRNKMDEPKSHFFSTIVQSYNGAMKFHPSAIFKLKTSVDFKLSCLKGPLIHYAVVLSYNRNKGICTKS